MLELKVIIVVATALVAGACAISPEDTPEDTPEETERVDVAPAHERPAPDALLAAVAEAPLVVVARPRTAEMELRYVTVARSPEELTYIVAEVEVIATLSGKASSATLLVEMRDTSDRAPLVPGRDVLLTLYPQDGAKRLRVDHSLSVVDDRVPALLHTLESLTDGLEVAHAR